MSLPVKEGWMRNGQNSKISNLCFIGIAKVSIQGSFEQKVVAWPAAIKDLSNIGDNMGS